MASTYVLPADLPVPVDDGVGAHLPGAAVSAILLPATSGRRNHIPFDAGAGT